MQMKPVEETIAGVLGIEFGDITPDRVTATMPVHAATHQPFGQL
ncbi:MAG: esterase, partial [Planococcus sp. (in: Bacteria)]|nr:esterase [Planococcus sp. (in: firmicutes)]